MRKYIPFGLVVILIGLLLVPLFATATLIPSYTYYSDGSYDGGLWYSATTGSSSQVLYEYSEVIPASFYYTNNATTYLAQVFTPKVNQTLTQVSLMMFRLGTPGLITVELWDTAGGIPNGLLVGAHTIYDTVSLPTGAENATWVDVGLSYSMDAGTQYAIALFAPSAVAGVDMVYWGFNGNSYSDGNIDISIDSGVGWGYVSTTQDFCFKQYGIPTYYSQVHDSAVGNISNNINIGVGQVYVPASGSYVVHRGGLFFDTSNLITEDNIQSATLQVWVGEDYSTANEFELTMVDGSGLNGPMQTSDYYELGLNTDNLGSVTTVGLSTTGYTTINLNALGLTKISKSTYTKIGLRSSRDISSTVPTGSEYLFLYAGESSHPPILTVSYTISGLGIPDEMLISTVYVVSGFQDPKDALFVWQNTLRYETNPTVAPAEYFVVQLYNSTDNLIAQTIVNRWGWTPLSIYLDNVTATTILPWKSTCTLVMTGSSLYGTPTNFDNFTYEVQSVDWRGVLSDKNALLDIWCRATSNWMEDKNGLPRNTYMTTGATGTWSFDPLNPDGGPVFLQGIPYLDVARPNLFLIGSGDYTQGKPISGAYASGLYTAVWGTYWSNAFNDLASGWGAGLGGQWIIGGMMGGVIIMIGAVVRQKSADPNISLVMMGFGFVIAMALGSIAMDVALVGTIILLFVFLKQTFITTQ